MLFSRIQNTLRRKNNEHVYMCVETKETKKVIVAASCEGRGRGLATQSSGCVSRYIPERHVSSNERDNKLH